MRCFCALLLTFALLIVPFAPLSRAVVIADDIVVAALIAFGAACGLTMTFSGFDSEGAASAVKSYLLDHYLPLLGVSSISAWVDSGDILTFSGILRLAPSAANAFRGFWSWIKEGSFAGAGPVVDGQAVSLASTWPTFSEYDSSKRLVEVKEVYSPEYIFDFLISSQSFSIDDDWPSRREFFSLCEQYEGSLFIEHIINGGVSTSSSILFSFFFLSDLEESSTYEFGSFVSPTFVLSGTVDRFSRVIRFDEVLFPGDDGFSSTTIRAGSGLQRSSAFTWVLGADALVAPTDLGVQAGTISIPSIVSSPDYAWVDVDAPDSATLDEVTDLILDDAIAGELAPGLALSETQPGPLEPTPSPPPVVVIPGWPERLPTIPEVSIIDKLPFCIPGDLLSIVGALQAEPLAPVLVFDFEPWGLPGTAICLDLSRFDEVAALCRRLELVLYVVGLAVATRRIYIRG